MGDMSNPYEALEMLVDDFKFRADQARRDAETLIARAEVWDKASADAAHTLRNYEQWNPRPTPSTEGVRP